MPEDIFRAGGAVGGVYKGTLVALVIGGETAAKGSLVQSITIDYNRQVNRVWELGSEDTYFILGHTDGAAQLNKIVGQADTDILERLADACEAINQTISVSSTAGGIGEQCEGDNLDFDLTISGPILNRRSFAISADNFLITENATIMFAALLK
jgi:hypothetical protein